MAQQKSIIKLKGNIGDITFFKTRDGYQAREKGGVDANRIATDPKFQRTRENGAEFGRAGKAGKLLRTALRSLIQNGKDSGMTSRLTRDFVKVIQADAVNTRGQRNVIDGEVELLSGFEFNQNGRISSTIFMPYSGSIDRASGVLRVDFPAFVASNDIAAPAGATHFVLQSAGVLIDFESGNSETALSTSALLAIDASTVDAFQLENSVSAGSTSPLFLALGIEFYQQVNGKNYVLNNGSFNGLSLILIDGQGGTDII